MELTPTDSRVTEDPVIYAGRLADRMSDTALLEDCRVLDDWDVLPVKLGDKMQGANALVVLDPLSFPFDVMTREQRDVPWILFLSPQFDADFLEAVFGEPVFRRLTFFDRVVCPNSGVWEALRNSYRWSESQRIETDSESPEVVVAEICALLQKESGAPDSFGGERYTAYRYWNERGDALSRSAPHRAICNDHHGPAKAAHLVQAPALEPQFDAARGMRDDDVPFEVLEVGAGVGRWAASLDPGESRYAGLDVSDSMVEVARANFPEARFDHLGPSLDFPYEDESFDLAFTVAVLHHNDISGKRTLLSEMWRVVKPGGRLVFLEDFVAPKKTDRSTVYSVSVLEFVELILEATAGQVVLEHVESLRYPRDDFFRGGVISLSKLGVPKRW